MPGDREQVGDQRARPAPAPPPPTGRWSARPEPVPADLRSAVAHRRWRRGRRRARRRSASVHVREVVEQVGVRRAGWARAGSTRRRPGVRARGCCAARSPAARPARPSPAPDRGAAAGTARSARRTAPRRRPPGARRRARRWTARRAARSGPARRRRRRCSPLPRAAGSAILRTTTAACSRGRRSGARGTTVAATSATPPPIRASVHRDERRARVGSSVLTTMACTAAWLTKSTPCVEQQRGRHGERDDQRDLPAARSRASWVSMSPTKTPMATPTVTSRDPAQPLAVGGAEADHGRDRARRTARVAEDVGGDRPRRHRRRSRTGRPATPWRAAAHRALAQRGPTAGDRELEVRRRGSAVARQVLARRYFLSVDPRPCSIVSDLGQLVVGLRGAAEGGQRQQRLEPLPGDRLGVGELLEPVGAVDAAEAGVADAAEGQRRDRREARSPR